MDMIGKENVLLVNCTLCKTSYKTTLPFHVSNDIHASISIRNTYFDLSLLLDFAFFVEFVINN